MMSGLTDTGPFWDFVRRLTERIEPTAGGRLPPLTLLARVWALCTDPGLTYVEAHRTQLRNPGGTRWEIVLFDATDLIHITGQTTASEWWDYDDQRGLSANRRLAQDGEATVCATRRRLADICATDASGSAPDWLVVTRPQRPTWTLTWQDGHAVTLPLSATPSDEMIEAVRRLACRGDDRGRVES